MKYLCLPAPVTQLLQRIVELVSYLTVSNHYLLFRRAQVEFEVETSTSHQNEIAPNNEKRVSAGNALYNAIRSGNAGFHATEKVLEEKVGHERDCIEDSTSLSSSSYFTNTSKNHFFWPKNSQRFWQNSRSVPAFSASKRLINTDAEASFNGHDKVKVNFEKDDLKNSNKRDRPATTPTSAQYADLPPIYKLIYYPALFDPIRVPRYPIVLCHGLYGFDVRGPSSFPRLQMHYWSNVLKVLKKKVGAEVMVTGVPGTGSIESRAEKMDQFLNYRAHGRAVNLVAHSMGGLDCRHLITHHKPEDYVPVSLTTVSTPHRGSPFMDWCMNNIGIGKHGHRQKLGSISQSSGSDPQVNSPDTDKTIPPTPSESQFSLSSLPSSFTTLLLSIIDSPAYANLTTSYLQDRFNPVTPNDPNVKYYSVAARTQNINVWHPLWLPKMVLDGVEEKEREQDQSMHGTKSSERDDWGNDGLVSVRSANWGEFLGTLENCDHWEIRGSRGSNIDWNIDIPASLSNTMATHGWNLKDWTRFVGVWKNEKEKLEKTNSERSNPIASAAEKNRDNTASDEALKSSTDKLSAVLDWIVDQVPFGSKSHSPAAKAQEPPSRPSKFTARFDLERFYVALCRKLYDDGL